VLICITGPESSGKTTMSNFLAHALCAPLVPEFARGYLNDKAEEYTFDDLAVIAKGQLDLINEALYDEVRESGKKNTPGSKPRLFDNGTDRSVSEDRSHKVAVVITDTMLLVVLIWSLHKYGKASAAVHKLYAGNRPDLYILCKPDIPWEYDRLRENEQGRYELYEKYLHLIKSSGVPYFEAEGLGQERMEKALQWIESLM